MNDEDSNSDFNSDLNGVMNTLKNHLTKNNEKIANDENDENKIYFIIVAGDNYYPKKIKQKEKKKVKK
jgi:hypothetical protein